jgi:gamma-glutamyl:cysteine ligase YbdK (ATP-grasp superfamily)
MGVEIDTDHFTEADELRFKQRLDQQLRVLQQVLRRPDFDRKERRVGTELELFVVDAEGRACAISKQLIKEANTPVITLEMGAFVIELSTPPSLLTGKPFSALGESMRRTVQQIRTLAGRHGARVVPISILPTLRVEDFSAKAITDYPRYRALARGMSTARGTAFDISIEGEDRLLFSSHDAVAMEAANTAFQVHLSTTPDEFAAMFNAALLLSAPALAAAGNSPTFLGKRLWHETRVALFKQAGDDRPTALDGDTALPPRVNFGNGWVREGAHELFLESVTLHPPLLSVCTELDQATRAAERAGQLPKLHELRLHHGTVWTWNRPVYDPENGGSLRIELRSLPAGPSYEDMLANASFLVGAMLGIRDRMPELVNALPFALAKQNFFRAAQHGLDAPLSWPKRSGRAPCRRSARDVLLELIPIAREGLLVAGVESGERAHYLDVFEARVRSGQTGAVWQRRALSELQARGLRGHQALAALLDRYIAGFESQQPVHEWPLDPSKEAPDV